MGETSERLIDRVISLREHTIGSDEYDGAVLAFWGSLRAGHRDVLRQIMKAPVWDGDICSKASRDDLIAWGLATRCCANFEDGYTTATYLAGSVWRVVHER